MQMQNSDSQVSLHCNKTLCRNILELYISFGIRIIVFFWCKPILLKLLNNCALPREGPCGVLPFLGSANMYPNTARGGDVFLRINLRLYCPVWFEAMRRAVPPSRERYPVLIRNRLEDRKMGRCRTAHKLTDRPKTDVGFRLRKG